MPNTTQSPKCATCVHRLSIPGDRHSRCNAGRTAHVTANPTGVRRGWFNWPLNFDPVWLVTCDSWTDEPPGSAAASSSTILCWKSWRY